MYYVIFHDSCEKGLSAKGNEMKKKNFFCGEASGGALSLLQLQ